MTMAVVTELSLDERHWNRGRDHMV